MQKFCVALLSLLLFCVVPSVSLASGSQIYWGARIDGDVYVVGQADAPYSKTTWETFTAHTKKAPSIIQFGMQPPWKSSFSKSPLELTRGLGAIPLVEMGSTGATLGEVAAGKKDTAIATWADAAKGYGHPFFLRFDWGMNVKELPWGVEAAQSPSAFVAAWRHIHDIFVQRGAANVTWVWSPTAVSPGSTAMSLLYPGTGYVDWIGINGFNYGANPIEPKVWASFSEIFTPTYSQLLAIDPTKPMMIAEFASTEIGGSKAQWIKDAFSSKLETNFPQVEAVSWFNWNIPGWNGRWDWPIESSSTAQAAFAEKIGSNYYAGNVFAGLSGLSPVTPLP
jgi:Glycosyl hydrolase family 26